MELKMPGNIWKGIPLACMVIQKHREQKPGMATPPRFLAEIIIGSDMALSCAENYEF